MQESLHNILVVDDQQINRALLSSAFSPLGINVFEASNGLEALKIAVHEKFKIIIMDIEMPLMDGLEATENLRKSGNDSFIIGFSGSPITDIEQKCLNSGMNQYFQKPMGIRDLMKFVGNHCA